MKFEYEDLEVLLKIQAIDLAVMKIKKQRAELPQRVKVQLLRKKRDEISAKLDQALRRSRMKTASFPTSRSAPKSSSTPLELITVKLSRNRRKWLASRSVATPWRSRCSRCR